MERPAIVKIPEEHYPAIFKELSQEPWRSRLVSFHGESLNVTQDVLDEMLKALSWLPMEPMNVCSCCERRVPELQKDYRMDGDTVHTYIVCADCRFLNGNNFYKILHANGDEKEKIVRKLLEAGERKHL